MSSAPVITHPLLTVADLAKRFGPESEGWAVRGASFEVAAGECVAIVGESGSGKTTLARMVSGLEAPTAGSANVAGIDVAAASVSRAGRRRLTSVLQLVFQDPSGALDSTKTVADLVGEPLIASGRRPSRQRRALRVRETLEAVGLSQAFAERRPRELSGGQRQRVVIARALVSSPQLLILDEPVASLDVSVQGQVLSLLSEVQHERDIAMLFIAHDLGVVRAISDRVIVMYRGVVVESGPTERVLTEPRHPYTQSLLWSTTAEGRREIPASARASLANEDDTAADTKGGCRFRDRCWRRIDACDSQVLLVQGAAGHQARCNVPMNEVAIDAEGTSLAPGH